MNRGPAAWWEAAGSRSRIAVGLVLLVACVAAVAGAALAKSGPPTVQVTAVDAATGAELPPNPALNPGQKVIVTAVGFHPGASIQIALQDVKILETAPADSQGRSVFPFTVPSWIQPGQHALLFVGLEAHTGAGQAPGNHRGGSGDVDNIELTVPLVDPWKFRTPGGSPSTSPSLSVSASSTQHGGQGHHGHKPPSNTGFGALPFVIIGAIAIAIGAVLTAASRRRRGMRE